MSSALRRERDAARAHAARWKHAAKQYRALFQLRATSCVAMTERWDKAELELKMTQMELRQANRTIARMSGRGTTLRKALVETLDAARQSLRQETAVWLTLWKDAVAVANATLDDDYRAWGDEP